MIIDKSQKNHLENNFTYYIAIMYVFLKWDILLSVSKKNDIFIADGMIYRGEYVSDFDIERARSSERITIKWWVAHYHGKVDLPK